VRDFGDADACFDRTLGLNLPYPVFIVAGHLGTIPSMIPPMLGLKLMLPTDEVAWQSQLAG
jgi:hypothetical protein